VKLVAGLGNPGEEYISSRHNVGYITADRLAARLNSSIGAMGAKFKRKYVGVYTVASLPHGGGTGILKPRTFMNRSGRSVAMAVRDMGVDLRELVVVHDDVNLPFGKIRIKFGGGTGGHKGLESILSCLGTEDFVRLRIGIDRPGQKDITDYVLGKFNPAESVILENEVFPKALDAIITILENGPEAAMNDFNR
jgi:PTH1 family peptidyl-tRNA hydrolase